VFGSSNLLREQITVQMDNVASCSSKSASLKNGINIYHNFIRTVPNDNLNGLFRTYSQQFYKEQCATTGLTHNGTPVVSTEERRLADGLSNHRVGAVALLHHDVEVET